LIAIITGKLSDSNAWTAVVFFAAVGSSVTLQNMCWAVSTRCDRDFHGLSNLT